MENSNFIYGVTNLACGILFILISLPLVLKKVPMNRLYGFRLKKAFSSEENWYEINRYGGRELIKWSLVLVGVGVLNFLFPTQDIHTTMERALYSAGPMTICVVAVTIKTIAYSKTLNQ